MRECPSCNLCFSDDVHACSTDGTPTRQSLPGSLVIADRYKLESRLGRGAMGQVYLARDLKFENRKVAVKTVRHDILNSDDLQEGEAITRFGREAQSAASIIHPNTVSVTDFGESDEGVFYLVMEYVEGETLHRLLRREGTLPIGRTVRLLRQISDGVEAAHELGILHRDLKPANIFIMSRGTSGDGFVKVGDFGLAKMINQTVTDTSSDSTPSSRGIVGTPEFMSPEQIQPELPIDRRSDLYALGTIAYLMLGGKTPFTGDLMQLVMQKVMHQPMPLASLRSDIPGDVDRVVMKALATDPSQRPATVSQWMDELERAAQDVEESGRAGGARLVVMAPPNAEIYIDDERRGSIGSSGRVVLSGIPPGRHVLRVARTGERDDERVIEVREGGDEQVIQANLRPFGGGTSQPSPSQGISTGGSPASSIMPGIVSCRNCNARFAEGVKFCGRCGSSSFSLVVPGQAIETSACPRCGIQLPVNSKFCGRCGNHLDISQAPLRVAVAPIFNNDRPAQAERLCARCGTAYPPNIRFCGRCGNSL